MGQNWLSVSAASEWRQSSTEAMTRMQQGVRIKESSWTEVLPKRWKQPKEKDGKNMQKDARKFGCTLVNGSSWSTEKKYMRRYKGMFDIFFGIELRLRKEEMEEQFKKEAKEEWSFAADAARITDENANSEDHRWTAIWERGHRRRSGQMNPRQRRLNCPSMGKRARRYAGLLSVLLALGGLDPDE